MRRTATLFSLLLASTGLGCTEHKRENAVAAASLCKERPIASEQEAIAVATTALRKKYGERKVETQQPFYAMRQEGSWSVYGTNPNTTAIAGNFAVFIDAQTGCVLHMQIDT